MWWNAKSALSRQKQNKVQIPSSCTNQTKNYDNLQKSKLRHIRMKYSLKLSKSAAVGRTSEFNNKPFTTEQCIVSADCVAP